MAGIVHALGRDQKPGTVLELPIRRERHPECVEIVGNVRVAHVPAHSSKGWRAEKSFSYFYRVVLRRHIFLQCSKGMTELLQHIDNTASTLCSRSQNGLYLRP
jgi:hypothetical protein